MPKMGAVKRLTLRIRIPPAELITGLFPSAARPAMRRHLRELASAGETPEPHTPLIPGAMYGGDGVM